MPPLMPGLLVGEANLDVITAQIYAHKTKPGDKYQRFVEEVHSAVHGCYTVKAWYNLN